MLELSCEQLRSRKANMGRLGLYYCSIGTSGFKEIESIREHNGALRDVTERSQRGCESDRLKCVGIRKLSCCRLRNIAATICETV